MIFAFSSRIIVRRGIIRETDNISSSVLKKIIINKKKKFFLSLLLSKVHNFEKFFIFKKDKLIYKYFYEKKKNLLTHISKRE